MLTRIVLTSKENKKRSEASGLKKTIETFDFRMHCYMGAYFDFITYSVTKVSDHQQ